MTKTNNRLSVMEILLIIYLFIGMMSASIFNYSRYVISLIIQLRCFFFLKNKPLKEFLLPIASYLGIFVIGVTFVIIDVPTSDLINRILPLFSIFGLTWLKVYKDNLRFDRVIEIVIRLYKYLGILIIIDAAVYGVSGYGIWKPIIFLSYRFSGPFYDSNYMGMLYVFLILVCRFGFPRKRNISTIAIFMIIWALSGSWSALIIGLFVWIVCSIFTVKRLFLKQIIILFVYFLLSLWIFNGRGAAESFFAKTVSVILPFDSEHLIAKFNSLFIRIDTQINAIILSFKNGFVGFGPRTILKYFEHDTHNSFVAMLFELGAAGFLLLLINMPLRTNSKLSDAASTFVILSALVLDIHYTIIYSFLILFIVFEKNLSLNPYAKKKLLSGAEVCMAG